MNQANRKSVLTGMESQRKSRCGRFVVGTVCPLGIAMTAVLWACVAMPDDAPKYRAPSRWVVGNARGSPFQSRAAALGAEDDETIPISRVVPRANAIPSGAYQVRRLPDNSQRPPIETADGEMEEESDDVETNAEGEDEDVDAEEIESAVEHQPNRRIADQSPAGPPAEFIAWMQRSREQKGERSPARPVSQQRSAFREPVPVAAPPIEPADEPAIEGVPSFPDLDETIERPVPDAGFFAPETEEYVIDEPWPQDPAGYDLSCPPAGVKDCHCWGPIKKFMYFNQTNGDIGIGHERVMFAPFEIETSQPANNFRLKMMSAFDLHNPDRAEYIWAKIGGPGPMLPENSVDYQRFDAIYEAGGKRFSFVTNIPLLYMHADNNGSGAGIGNISLAPKMVLVSGNDWQITSIFRTYLPTGAASRGTSNGLVALEPGVLVRYRWSPRTYVHSQLKYWVPLSGDPIASGNVFNYGLGVSHVLYETDTFAIIPVLETVGWTVGGGTETLSTGLTTSANTTFVNIQPGVRFVLGPKGDLGLCEFGISGGFATSARAWYQEQVTVEFRWSW